MHSGAVVDVLQGVCIGGLGTFTFSQKRIDVGGNKFLQIQRPVFVVSERFSMKHNLHVPKQHVSGMCTHYFISHNLIV